MVGVGGLVRRRPAITQRRRDGGGVAPDHGDSGRTHVDRTRRRQRVHTLGRHAHAEADGEPA
jgi:hypothetical protein